MMNRFILAVQFLTVFPIKKDVPPARSELAASMAYFPLVGAVQGVILVAAYLLLALALPEGVSTALLLAILVLTNGALHIDGYADTIDGLAGGGTPEERLRIMRDSSVGAVGVVFVALLLLVKYSALMEVAPGVKARVLFIFPAAGRWAMVPMACWARYAREGSGLGGAFTENSRATLLGGVTGDVFGFQSEVAEALFLVLFLLLSKALEASSWR
ncbi:MAG: adenosylcobinamide-GDP ribazoletransferase [Deltaproteobacteria bacterium]|nr:adenosylcobinamide-GDP ribazoletransferase [Deltaproteobacteria bacterium]